jgi:hypothetical protein
MQLYVRLLIMTPPLALQVITKFRKNLMLPSSEYVMESSAFSEVIVIIDESTNLRRHI